MRKKIFIGSSKESLDAAKQVSSYFAKTYDCTIWEDDFFRLNDSTYDTLLKKSIYFDYAIFIGGKDDFVRRYSNNRTKKAVRDNVYFELGLYTGILSKDRTYFFVHKEVQIATDLLGITLIQYENPDDILNGCQKVAARIKEEDKLNHITLLPSTSLAIGYYKNFLEPLGNALSECECISYEGKEYRVGSWRIQIVLPQNCNEDWRIWANEFYNFRRAGNVEIKGKPRGLSVRIETDKLRMFEEMKILDVPQSLTASFAAVEMVVQKHFIGYPEEITYMKEKEVSNFVQTLQNLIESNLQLRRRIEFIRADDYDAVI